MYTRVRPWTTPAMQNNAETTMPYCSDKLSLPENTHGSFSQIIHNKIDSTTLLSSRTQANGHVFRPGLIKELFSLQCSPSPIFLQLATFYLLQATTIANQFRQGLQRHVVRHTVVQKHVSPSCWSVFQSGH